LPPLGADDAALVERVGGVELVPAVLGEPSIRSPALLVGLEDEHDVALERDLSRGASRMAAAANTAIPPLSSKEPRP
jgi:hypothetical protein